MAIKVTLNFFKNPKSTDKLYQHTFLNSHLQTVQVHSKQTKIEANKTFPFKVSGISIAFSFDVFFSLQQRLFFVYLICIASYQPVPPCLNSILHSRHIFRISKKQNFALPSCRNNSK